MNLLRLALVLLLGWLIGRWLKVYLEKRNPGPTDMTKCPKCQTYVAQGAKHICKMAWLTLALVLVATGAQADAGGRYLIEVTGSNVTASVEVNGIKAERWNLGPEATAGASLNHWLKQGSNTLTFKASPAAGGAAHLSVRVYFLGIGLNGATNIVNLLEIPDIARAQRGVTVSFNLAAAPSLTLWRAAPPPQALTPAQAMGLVTGLRSELISVAAVGGGFEDIKALEAERADLLRAFGSSATPQPLALAAQNPQAKVEVSKAPVASDLAVEALGNTGLVRVGRKDNMPLMAVRQSGQVMAVPAVIVGWVNGTWQILRRAN